MFNFKIIIMKKFNLLFTMFLMLLFVSAGWAQQPDSIWAEDFYETLEGDTENSPEWFTTTTSGIFKVSQEIPYPFNRYFEGTDAEADWYTRVIDVSTYTDIYVEVEEFWSNTSVDLSDSIVFYYELNDDGNLIEFETNGNNHGVISGGTASLNAHTDLI